MQSRYTFHPPTYVLTVIATIAVVWFILDLLLHTCLIGAYTLKGNLLTNIKYRVTALQANDEIKKFKMEEMFHQKNPTNLTS